MLSDRQTLRHALLIIGRLLLCLCTALLGVLALPGGKCPILALVMFVPLGLALHRSTRVECFVYAYLAGFLGWIASTGGLATGLAAYSKISPQAAIGVVVLGCAYLALPYGLFGILYGTLKWFTGPGGVFKAAACLTLLLGFFPSPLPLDPSHALYRFPLLVQVLDLGGPPLLLFGLLLFNWLLVDIILRLKERRSCWSSGATLAGLCFLVVGYGTFRLAELRAELSHSSPERALRVGYVQPNISLENDFHQHSNEALNPYRSMLEESADLFATSQSVDLVVWPETPVSIPCENDSGAVRLEVQAAAANYKTAFLINCSQSAGNGQNYNTQMLIKPSGQTLAYHKQILFPFTEYLPGENILPEAKEFFPGTSQYAAGSESVVLPVKDSLVVFPAICYEILFPGQTREFVRRGGNVMISPSNDAWFGLTRIPEFQIAAGVYQAVEYRIPVVRDSNSGPSIAIQATGEIVPNSRTLPFTRTTRLVEVVAPRTRTTFFLIGNVFLYGLMSTFLLSLVFELRKRKFRPTARR